MRLNHLKRSQKPENVCMVNCPGSVPRPRCPNLMIPLKRNCLFLPQLYRKALLAPCLRPQEAKHQISAIVTR